jgi:hypothetical protein
MKIKMFFSLLASLIIAVSVMAGDGKTGYTGNWKIDKVKSSASNSSLLLSEISFTVKNDSLLTMRTYESSNGESYVFNENLTLDSKEYNIVIYEMPRKAKAQWSEKGSSLLIESTTIFTNGSGEQNVTSTEIWTLSESGNQLTYDFVTKTSEGSVKGTLYFNKS